MKDTEDNTPWEQVLPWLWSIKHQRLPLWGEQFPERNASFGDNILLWKQEIKSGHLRRQYLADLPFQLQ